jgi:hypothetical protein
MRNLIRLSAVVLSMVVISGPALPGQTPATGKVMREKLAHSEKVLEALMTSNFAQLAQESQALADATKAPGWAVLKTSDYARYSAGFLRASEDLREAATKRDSDAAAISYVSLTLSCYQCHRYMKGARIAR